MCDRCIQHGGMSEGDIRVCGAEVLSMWGGIYPLDKQLDRIGGGRCNVHLVDAFQQCYSVEI